MSRRTPTPTFHCDWCGTELYGQEAPRSGEAQIVQRFFMPKREGVIFDEYFVAVWHQKEETDKSYLDDGDRSTVLCTGGDCDLCPECFARLIREATPASQVLAHISTDLF